MRQWKFVRQTMDIVSVVYNLSSKRCVLWLISFAFTGTCLHFFGENGVRKGVQCVHTAHCSDFSSAGLPHTRSGELRVIIPAVIFFQCLERQKTRAKTIKYLLATGYPLKKIKKMHLPRCSPRS